MNVEDEDTGDIEDVDVDEVSDDIGLVNVPMVGLSVVMFSSSSSVDFPDCSLEVTCSGNVEEVEVSTGSVVDFVVSSIGASVNGTERKNSNNRGDEDNDVTGDLEAETTSSSSETFSLGSQEKFPVPLVV